MNAFEDIVKLHLEEKGYWVRQSVKVNISKQDKVYIGTYSMPRPEIDLVALNIKENELLLIEVKSLLDSYGVWFEAVSGQDEEKYTKRYKLFTNNKFREVVTKRLREEYLTQGLINKNTEINYALAAGNIKPPSDESRIREYFVKQGKGWKLFSPRDIKETIKKLSHKGWEDNQIVMAAKLIMRT